MAGKVEKSLKGKLFCAHYRSHGGSRLGMNKGKRSLISLHSFGSENWQNLLNSLHSFFCFPDFSVIFGNRMNI